MNKPYNPNNDYEVPHAPSDSISSLAFSPVVGQDFLVSGSWDNKVSIWQIGQGVGTPFAAQPTFAYQHDAPVLCVTFSKDGRVFSGSCDTTAKCWQVGQSAQPFQIAKHDAPIKTINYVDDLNVVMTGSWDKTIRYWDTRTPTAVSVVQAPERVYSTSVQGQLAVVATAERHIVIYDLRNPTKEYKRIQSPLKFQTRVVAAFPDKTGFAVGSIEGRVAIHHVEDANASKNFAFKCHRSDKNIYAVNAIVFHPRYGTFATAGADGAFNFWDKDSKQRLRTFKNANEPISAAAFNANGNIFAYAVSYDWSMGADGMANGQNAGNYILLHNVVDDEIKNRSRA